MGTRVALRVDPPWPSRRHALHGLRCGKQDRLQCSPWAEEAPLESLTPFLALQSPLALAPMLPLILRPNMRSSPSFSSSELFCPGLRKTSFR
ncbi:hypothetical protein MPTK1_1g27190 [Marchantia polymorpha subsp. ruderalis]|uniref:Uncharacterized protein n=2 Tax=Marchantia polymorpha TaxID=3197 RepID=A0AAF6AUS7_MARPO|nr:hypothetical protein MARPO_0002s0159 [Marchantia polymorpha]PTQ49687.1 hypothetical protein MARPO_0002s0159 [Marchantia polymorpha]BBN00197.1 hypothetical protein Mp_1g27190 [Marchantia polymorpha subsp. ruderalis]BBN00198.1 hypothetical protein Mp_1g27190 [Marchantia polymorpha subsp. ruderalis]|eukprot:PTQ49686.1 hypothetical protein MARPO_0002s0159 [Marchantia polymorpha]